MKITDNITGQPVRTGELRAEQISYGELAELQSLAGHIEPGDVELLEPAGVPEFSTVYQIEVSQTIVTTVEVTAESEDEALAKIDRRDFPLPPRDEWSSVKGSFEYELADQTGGE